jgi:hypothetical protein
MTLPILAVPKYELTLPSTGKKIKYRPFLVKEEKILLIAEETSDEYERSQAIGQIIENCTFDAVKYSELPVFDVEFIFLKLRAKSVGEIVTLNLLCQDDKKTFAKVKVNINDVKVDKIKPKDNIIQLDDSVGLVLKYPTMNDAVNRNEDFSDLLSSSILSVYDGDTVFDREDFSEEELKTFIESMNSKQYIKTKEFFESIPRLYLDVPVLNPETKVKTTQRIEGIESFF